MHQCMRRLSNIDIDNQFDNTMSTSNNRWPTTSTAQEEEEMPSLINSDSSRGALEDASEHSLASGYSDHYNNSSIEHQPDNGILQATSADSFTNPSSSPIIDRSIRNGNGNGAIVESSGTRSAATRSISASPPRQRPRSRARGPPNTNTNRRAHSRSRSRPRQQRPRSRSRPRAGRSISRARQPPQQQQQQQQQPTNTRTKSPARSVSQARSRPNLRFSYSRRASLGGTTIYRTPAMATLDTHLRNTSGLRLQTDGTCNFLFENQRFVLESNEEDSGDYLFYASFGSLKELQTRMAGDNISGGNKSRNLLRMLATWNEELKQRSTTGGNNHATLDGGGQPQPPPPQDTTGLLRIDSSKSEGPHVAFIYYGHMEDITNSTHFQETLDDFVDDALDFKDKLHYGYNNNKEEEYIYEGSIAQAVKDADSILGTSMGGDVTSTMSGSNNKVVMMPPPPPVRQQVGNRDALNASLQTSLSDNTSRASGGIEREREQQQPTKSPSDTHESKESVATLATTTIVPTPTSTTTTTSSSSSSSSTKPNPEAAAITSTDIYNAHNKKSVFTKMIQSLRSKTTNNNNNGGAYIDPNNPACAFVVDKNDAPKINLSRGGGGSATMSSSGKRGSLLDESERTKRKSMLDENTTGEPSQPRSPHRRGSAMTTRARTPVRGRSFHVADERFDHHRAPPPQKGRSFHVADGISPQNNARPTRKSTSFATTDEYYGAPVATTRPIQRKSKSFATDDYYHHNGEQPSRGRRQSALLPYDENGHSQTRGRSTKRSGSKSFHTDNEQINSSYHSTAKGKSRSFHQRSSMESSSDYEHSSQSIDIYDQNANAVAAARGLHQSEPMVSKRYPGDLPPPPPPGRPSSRQHHSSRRNSAEVSSGRPSSSSRHHHSRRHSNEIDVSKGGNRHAHHRPSRSSAGNTRMNQSEPILSAPRKNSPTPL